MSDSNYCYMKNTMESFYRDLSGNIFKNINEERIEELIKKSRVLREYFEDPKQKPYYTLILNSSIKYGVNNKYIDVMKRVQKSQNILKVRGADKFLFFLFIVDPNFELYIEYITTNKTEELKHFMLKKYGVYDPTLISLEKFFVKYFLSQKEKENLNEKIKRRVFK